MPSRYSSDHSLNDAQKLADNLGINLLTIPIETAHAAMEKTLFLSSLVIKKNSPVLPAEIIP